MSHEIAKQSQVPVVDVRTVELEGVSGPPSSRREQPRVFEGPYAAVEVGALPLEDDLNADGAHVSLQVDTVHQVSTHPIWACNLPLSDVQAVPATTRDLSPGFFRSFPVWTDTGSVGRA